LPFVGATLDLTDNISAYASFATIFNPQTQTSTDLTLIKPITGDNLEGGLKGEWFGGRLNASIAVFQTRQKNTAEQGPTVLVGSALVTTYRGVDAKSQGIELEFAGEIAPGLQATGSYTIMKISGENGDPVRTFVPRNLAKLNLSYSPPSFDRLKFGVSGQYQSKIFLMPQVTDAAGVTDYRRNAAGQPIRIDQKGYALVDLFAKYDITENLSVSANLKNLTNVKYLQALNYAEGFYGAPRTILGTISLKY
ncbi:MAG: TonB-dependent receptor, partial [Sphingobium sp.]